MANKKVIKKDRKGREYWENEDGSYEDEKGRFVFRTIGGRIVRIHTGESLSKAMKESGEFKMRKDVADNVEFKDMKEDTIKRKGVTAEEYQKAEDNAHILRERYEKYKREMDMADSGTEEYSNARDYADETYWEMREAQDKYDKLMQKDGHIERKFQMPSNSKKDKEEKRIQSLAKMYDVNRETAEKYQYFPKDIQNVKKHGGAGHYGESEFGKKEQQLSDSKKWLSNDDENWLERQGHKERLEAKIENFRPSGDIDEDETRLNNIASNYFYDKVGVYNENIDSIATKWGHDKSIELNSKKIETDSTGTYAKNKEDQKYVNEQYIKEQSKLAQEKEKALQSRSLYADIHNEYTPEEIEYIAQDNKVHKMNSYEYPKERDEYHKFLQDKYGTYKEEEIKDENGRTDYIKLRKDFYSSRGKGATKDNYKYEYKDGMLSIKDKKTGETLDSYGLNESNYKESPQYWKDRAKQEFEEEMSYLTKDAIEEFKDYGEFNSDYLHKQKGLSYKKISNMPNEDYDRMYNEYRALKTGKTRVARHTPDFYKSEAYTGDNSDLKAKHTKEGIASYKKEVNDKIRAIITGKSKADKGLEKYGLRVERDNSAQKEFGKRYFGKNVEVIDNRTGKKIYSSYDNYFPSDDVVNAKHTSDTKGTQWHTIKSGKYNRENRKDVRDKFNYYDYLKKPYNEAKSQGDTLGQKVAQYKQDKDYLKQHEYEIKTATKTADRYLRTKNELDNYNLKQQYKGTYEYLKNTTNMSGEEILEYLKKIKK